MPAVIAFPDLSPVIFEIDLGFFVFALHWYALAYIGGFLIGWVLILRALKTERLWSNGVPLTREEFEDLLTWLIAGVILGGRLGYVLFYKPAYYFSNPVEIPMVWQGGMAFHGGFLGVIVGAGIWGLKHKKPLLSLGDLLAMATPTGLLLGRIANFVNAELWGKPWDGPWAVVFPGPAAQSCQNVGMLCARHPSQLYEAGMEGLILGTLILSLVWFGGALKRPGFIMGLFFAGYGLSRFIVEFFRQADAQFITAANPSGAVFLGMQMGQLLSLPMILIGLFFMLRAKWT
ncbi:prolipoprotein diacylglyceryl transferase [Celeribacter litoreus]|uniref:prolipoprotein diacylglyceryl transferase n=1 Tax=Celeribacter litoreus TaxID=2876714 RepID=UPI001CCC97C3|nr:prolipoprotein diacylglyceryl transferase [Celeribacter litoreus]MCA0042792.1 prolipoprotein diacylglyceryl transferase [Celeribacter litoreus]